MLAAFREVNFRRVYYSRMTSEFGDWAARLAVAALMYQQTGSIAMSGLAVAATVAAAVLGPWASSLGDVYPPRRVMLTADVFRAAVFAVLALVPMAPLPALALIFLASLAHEPFASTRAAILPELGPDARTDPDGHQRYWESANSITEYSAQAMQLASLAAGGLALSVLPAQSVLLINAATFLLSTVFLIPLNVREQELSVSSRAALAAGVSVIRARPLLLSLIVLAPAGTIGAVTMEALVPALTSPGGSAAGLAVLLAPAVPLGTLIGMMALTCMPSTSEQGVLWRRALTSLVVGNGGALVFLAAGSGALSLAAGYFCAGLAFAFFVPAKLILARLVPRHCRSSVVGVLDSGLLVTHAGAIALGSLVAGQVGVRWALIGLLALSLAAVPAACRRLSTAGPEAAPPPLVLAPAAAQHAAALRPYRTFRTPGPVSRGPAPTRIFKSP